MAVFFVVDEIAQIEPNCTDTDSVRFVKVLP